MPKYYLFLCFDIRKYQYVGYLKNFCYFPDIMQCTLQCNASFTYFSIVLIYNKIRSPHRWGQWLTRIFSPLIPQSIIIFQYCGILNGYGHHLAQFQKWDRRARSWDFGECFRYVAKYNAGAQQWRRVRGSAAHRQWRAPVALVPCPACARVARTATIKNRSAYSYI